MDYLLIKLTTSDCGNGNHNVAAYNFDKKNKVDQMLLSSYIRSLFVSVFDFAFEFLFP